MINSIVRRAGVRGIALAAAGLLLTACNVDKVLKVPDPDVSRPTDVSGKAGLPTLLAAAVGDFQVAFAGPASTIMAQRQCKTVRTRRSNVAVVRIRVRHGRSEAKYFRPRPAGQRGHGEAEDQ